MIINGGSKKCHRSKNPTPTIVIGKKNWSSRSAMFWRKCQK